MREPRVLGEGHVVLRPPCSTVTHCDCTCTNTRASGLLRRSTVVRLLLPPLLSQLGSPSDLAISTWVETGRLCYMGLCYLTQAEKVSLYPAPEGSSSLQGHAYVYTVVRTS